MPRGNCRLRPPGAPELAARMRNALVPSCFWQAAQFLRRLVCQCPLIFDRTLPRAIVEVAGVTETTRLMAETFRNIYLNNAWGSADSSSGTGCDLTQTAAIREVLPAHLRDLGVRRMLNVPCGDFHWMRMLDFDLHYIGADVVGELVRANTNCYANDRRRFQVIDIATDELPRVDLVFCRDLLAHFSFADATKAIANLKRSGATYLLTTTITDRSANSDITTGQWRALNLQLPPFNFPPPRRLINEQCAAGGAAWADKSLGLWLLSELPMTHAPVTAAT